MRDKGPDHKPDKGEHPDAEHDVAWHARPNQRLHDGAMNELCGPGEGVSLLDAYIGLQDALWEKRQKGHHRQPYIQRPE